MGILEIKTIRVIEISVSLITPRSRVLAEPLHVALHPRQVCSVSPTSLVVTHPLSQSTSVASALKTVNILLSHRLVIMYLSRQVRRIGLGLLMHSHRPILILSGCCCLLCVPRLLPIPWKASPHLSCLLRHQRVVTVLTYTRCSVCPTRVRLAREGVSSTHGAIQCRRSSWRHQGQGE